MDFETIFKRSILGHEGGFTDNPADPGNWTGGKCGKGALKGTNFGIAASSYPDVDIANLTEGEARAIYKHDWYDRFGMDKFSDAMKFQMFDAAINHGMANAAKMFQRAVGAKPDGIIGPKTLAKAAEVDENDKLLLFLAYRLKFFTSLGKFSDFGRGWSNRIADNLIFASGDN